MYKATDSAAGATRAAASSPPGLRGYLLLVLLLPLGLFTLLRLEDLRARALGDARGLGEQLAQVLHTSEGGDRARLFGELAGLTELRALALYSAEGELLVGHAASGLELPPAPRGQLQERRGRLLRSVVAAPPGPGGEARWLSIETDLSALDSRQVNLLVRAGLVALVGVVLAMALLPLALRSLLGPLQRLVEHARSTTAGRDVSLRPRPGEWREVAEVEAALACLQQRILTLEHQLDEQADSLEQQVRMRTAELVGLNREIARSRADAEEAVRSRSAYLAMMSHELRTPLNAVIGMSSLLGGRALDQESLDLARRIEGSGHRLLSIIGDVLDFSKIDAGRLELEEVRFEPHQPVEEALELMSHSAREKGIELVSFVEPGLPAVLGDAGRVQQIVLNYLGNALKFTARGHVALELVGGDSGRDAVELVLRVEDSGIGVPESRKAQLFQSFQQAGASIAREFGGSGLGLAITRRLAELMNGRVGFQSKVGEGSTFWCQLSLPRAATTPGRETAPAAGLRVAIAEPRGVTRRSLVRQLEALGCDVRAGEDCAWLEDELASGQVPELLLVDPELPDLDEVLGRLRGAGAPRVIGLGGAIGGDLGGAREGRGEGHLFAPFQLSSLEALLGSVRRGEAPASRDREPSRKVPSSVPISRPERILLVEDNETNHALTAHLLGTRGLCLDWAQDGEQAVAMCEGGAYDLILMDCQMPVMDGFVATRELRRLEREEGRPRVPILAMSASVAAEARRRAMAAGMDDFLPKPIDPDHVLRRIEHWLAGSASSKEAATRPAAGSSGPDPAQPGFTTAQPGLDTAQPGLDTAQPAPLPAHSGPQPGQSASGLDLPHKLELPEGLDGTVLGDLFDGGPDGCVLARDLMRSFLSAEVEFTRLGKQLEGGELEACGRLAHRLVSTCGSVGAVGLARGLRRLETLCEEGAGDAAACAEQLGTVRDQLAVARQAVLGLSDSTGADG